MSDLRCRVWPRLVIALVFAVALAAVLVFGPSEAEIMARQAAWKAGAREHLVLAVVVFFIAEVILVALSVPVATGLSVLAGILLGRWLGTAVVSFASSIGALLAMLAARYVLGDLLRRFAERSPRWRAARERLDHGIARDGWFYLLLIRLTPVLPFFVVNLGMGLTRMRLWSYYWATQLGMLPVTFVVVSAGAEVGEASSFRELASFERLWPLFAVAIVPIVLRILAARYLQRRDAILRRAEANPASDQNMT